MLQSTVYRGMALGFPGQIASSQHEFLNTVERVAVDAATFVGGFVQSNGTENEVIVASGAEITGDIVGVVVKNELIYSSDETGIVPEGSNITVLKEGNIYIATSLEAVQGEYVMLKTADGTLAFNSTATLTDYTYTGFRVEVGNATATSGIIVITSARG